MQFNVNVDCTPQEARAFLGLPDMAPLHAIYLDRMKELVTDGVRPEDMERLYRMWGSGMSEGIEQFQKLFRAASGTAPPR